MRAFFLAVTSVLLVVFNTTAKPVDTEMAKTIGQNFMQGKGLFNGMNKTNSLELVYTSTSSATGSLQPIVCFYVFISNPAGFVIVAADDRAQPILAYSAEGNFQATNIPSNISYWLNTYTTQIQDAVVRDITPEAEIADNWKTLSAGALPQEYAKKGVVGPLVQAKWNQDGFYNADCPFDSDANAHAYTGCVATAMAQIMDYWNYPSQGIGYHKYSRPKFGALSANFGATTYNWDSMPNIATEQSHTEISKLMYHVGVSVNMQYSAYSPGSGAFHHSLGDTIMPCAENALINYFRYSPYLRSIFKNNFTPETWYYTLKAELDAGRPILYSGYGSTGDPGHAFINDGYDNWLIHINWGWGGMYNGYFTLQALTPTGIGIGGGGGDYNADQCATIGILPAPQQIPADPYFNLKLNQDLNLSRSGNFFSGNAVIQNASSNTYLGVVAVGFFDQNDSLIDVSSYPLLTLNNKSIPANTAINQAIWFYCKDCLSQGTYIARMVYNNTKKGSDWRIISGVHDSIIDSVQIIVQTPGSIALTAPFLESKEFVSGKPLSLNLSLINKDSATFYGEYTINLYNYNDFKTGSLGTFVDTAGLPFNAQKTSIVISTDSLSLKPGYYYKARAEYFSYTDSTWRVMNASNFENPQYNITVLFPDPEADAFENNNTVQTAHKFALNFQNDTTETIVIPATCHLSSDLDYFKVFLPMGYRYSLSAELNDAFFPLFNSPYSLDAQFAYSTDGVNWSNEFDQTLPATLTINGGGLLYLRVSPFFTSETGNYRFNLTLKRTDATGFESLSRTIASNIYPNPANTSIELELSETIDKIELSDMQGKTVFVCNPQTNHYSLATSHLPSGLYLLGLTTKEGMVREKILIQH